MTVRLNGRQEGKRRFPKIPKTIEVIGNVKGGRRGAQGLRMRAPVVLAGTFSIQKEKKGKTV